MPHEPEVSEVAGDTPNRVAIFDTSLRDGEQAPGFSMNTAQKLKLAHALAKLKVDVMEVGFAAASPGDCRGRGRKR